MPTSMIAAISSVVATGRRMKMREGLIVRVSRLRLLTLARLAAGGDPSPAMRERSWASCRTVAPSSRPAGRGTEPARAGWLTGDSG